MLKFAFVKYSLVVIIFLFSFLTLKAQKEHLDIQPVFGKCNCNNFAGYIPYVPELMPLKRIRVVIHVFQRDDGSGNFENTPEDIAFIKKILYHTNGVFFNLDTMRPYPAISYRKTPTSRIEFVLDTILFHPDSRLYDFRKNAGTAKNNDTVLNEGAAFTLSEQLYDKYVKDNTEEIQRDKDSAINVFFVEGGSWNGKGMSYGINSKKWLYVLGSWYNYKFGLWAPDHWTNGLTLGHEFGHVMGLSHPFEYSNCKDLPRTTKGTTNNLMDYWPKEGNALTPCQLGTVHYGLEGHAGDISQAVIPDWCAFHTNEEMNIEKGDTVYFDGDRKLLGDLTIQPGAVLIVKCKLSMPPGGTITILPKGTLIIDGGKIYNACGLKWNAIVMDKNSSFLFFKIKSKSKFQVFNNGSFIDSENGIIKQVMY